jgi:hypothetical protein
LYKIYFVNNFFSFSFKNLQLGAPASQSPQPSPSSKKTSTDSQDLENNDMRVATPPPDPRGSDAFVVIPRLPSPLHQSAVNSNLNYNNSIGSRTSPSHAHRLDRSRVEPKFLDAVTDESSGDRYCLINGRRVMLQPGEVSFIHFICLELKLKQLI